MRVLCAPVCGLPCCNEKKLLPTESKGNPSNHWMILLALLLAIKRHQAGNNTHDWTHVELRVYTHTHRVRETGRNKTLWSKYWQNLKTEHERASSTLRPPIPHPLPDPRLPKGLLSCAQPLTQKNHNEIHIPGASVFICSKHATEAENVCGRPRLAMGWLDCWSVLLILSPFRWLFSLFLSARLFLVH